MAKKEKPPDPESMDAAVRVQLSEGAVAERGRALAEKLGVVKTLRDQKKADGERIQSLIDVALDEAEELRLEILEGAAEKRQGDLLFSETEAARALTDVAKAAGEDGASA